MKWEERIAIVATVRAPGDELRMFINYHLNIGIDLIFLFVDDPDDPVLGELSLYREVYSVRCTEHYWYVRNGEMPESIEERQIINANEALQLAKKLGFQWLVHLDSDELLYSKRNLLDSLNDCHADVVRLCLREAVLERGKHQVSNIFQTVLFRVPPTGLRIRLAAILGCQNLLFAGQFFRGHTASKIAIRLNDKIRAIRIHRLSEYDEALVIFADARDVFLLHFDSVGYQSWKTKWERRVDGSGLVRNLRGARKMQFEEYKLAKQGGDRSLFALYERLHTISRLERFVLSLLGMVINMKIDVRLFDRSPIC